MKEKIERIRKMLKKHNIDAWVVFSHHSYDIHSKYLLQKNISSPALVVISQDSSQVVISAMEAMMIDHQAYEVYAYKKGSEMKEIIGKIMKSFPDGAKIALNFVEADDALDMMNSDIIASGTKKALMKFNEKLQYVSAKNLIFDIRSVKTKKEISNHKEAARLAEELMETVVESIIKPGMTEKEIAALVEYECNKRGGVAFDAIVAAGSHAAIPHHEPGEKKIKTNQVLLIDYGVTYKWSNSDITHTYWIGSNPPEEVLNAYEAVDQAKEAAYKLIKAGVLSSDIEAAVRAKFKEFGYDPEKYFIHSTGHSLGIETHDIGIGIRRAYPDLPSKPLLENSIVTVEPGLYFENKFGIRLEDDCVVTKEGSIRLSNTPKKMKCLDFQ